MDVLIAEDQVEAERLSDLLVTAGYRGFESGPVAYDAPEFVADSWLHLRGCTVVIMRFMTQGESAGRTVELAGYVGAILDLNCRFVESPSASSPARE